MYLISYLTTQNRAQVPIMMHVLIKCIYAINIIKHSCRANIFDLNLHWANRMRPVKVKPLLSEI